MAIGNIYVISAIAIIGGGLFGFDISSMSAIIGTWVCLGKSLCIDLANVDFHSNTNATLIKADRLPRMSPNALARRQACREVSPRQCLEDRGLAH